MNNVTTLDKNKRLALGLAKCAETMRDLATTLRNPATRAELSRRAEALAARARAL